MVVIPVQVKLEVHWLLCCCPCLFRSRSSRSWLLLLKCWRIIVQNTWTSEQWTEECLTACSCRVLSWILFYSTLRSCFCNIIWSLQMVDILSHPSAVPFRSSGIYGRITETFWWAAPRSCPRSGIGLVIQISFGFGVPLAEVCTLLGAILLATVMYSWCILPLC